MRPRSPLSTGEISGLIQADLAATVPVHGRLVWTELLRATQCPSNRFTSRDQGTIPLRMLTLGCSRTHSPPCSPQNPGRNTYLNSLFIPIPHCHGANWPLLSLKDFEISDGSGHMNADVVDGIPLRKRIWKSVCTHSLFKLFRGYVGRV